MRSLRLWPLTASLLLALLLAACGAAQTSTSPTADAMAGMDHSNMPGMSATTAPGAAPTTDSMGGMAGMDHGVVSAEGQPYDAAFIDSMIVHHEGAIVMANQALEQAERPEIRELATAIIDAQEAEIAQMKEWRTAWFPDLPETTGMEMDMGPMEVPAGDAAFLVAMGRRVREARERKLERYLESDERVEKPRSHWGLKLDFGPPPPGGCKASARRRDKW